MLLLINWRKKVYIIKQKLILHCLNYEDRKVSIFKWDAAIKSVLTGAKATRSLLIRLLVINVWLLLHVYTSLAKYLQLLNEQNKLLRSCYCHRRRCCCCCCYCGCCWCWIFNILTILRGRFPDRFACSHWPFFEFSHCLWGPTHKCRTGKLHKSHIWFEVLKCL